MQRLYFLLTCGIYILSFVVTWNAMSCLNYEKFLKKGHVKQAQVLYVLLAMAVAYLVGSFICVFLYKGVTA